MVKPPGYLINGTAFHRLYKEVTRFFLNRITISFEETKKKLYAFEGETQITT